MICSWAACETVSYRKQPCMKRGGHMRLTCCSWVSKSKQGLSTANMRKLTIHIRSSRQYSISQDTWNDRDMFPEREKNKTYQVL